VWGARSSRKTTALYIHKRWAWSTPKLLSRADCWSCTMRRPTGTATQRTILMHSAHFLTVLHFLQINVQRRSMIQSFCSLSSSSFTLHPINRPCATWSRPPPLELNNLCHIPTVLTPRKELRCLLNIKQSRSDVIQKRKFRCENGTLSWNANYGRLGHYSVQVRGW